MLIQAFEAVSARLAATAIVAACVFALDAGAAESVTSEPAGKSPEGEALEIYTLRNSAGCEAKITNLGGIVMALTMPDRQGRMDDIVLGFDKVDGYFSPEYVAASPFFGALIGRYANRIARGQFVLDGKHYQVPPNNPPNSLHGGPEGFDKRVWEARAVTSADGPALELDYQSKDGEEGFPGNLAVKAVYTLTDKNELRVEFTATTDHDTVINLTNHAYFNLKGAGNGDILEHQVMINADRFTPIDKTSIPLGELRPVKGTPFDFTTPTAIGARIDKPDEQLANGKGYDHNFVLNVPAGPPALHLAARVYEPTSGRVLEVETTQPGLQFYSGNFLDGTLHGKGGRVYGKRFAFCMEAQHFPDSPNHPAYPSTVLKAGETFDQTIVYRFSVQN